MYIGNTFHVDTREKAYSIRATLDAINSEGRIDTLRQFEYQGADYPAGLCYCASEALYHNFEDKYIIPMVLNIEGSTHWYLCNLNSFNWDYHFSPNSSRGWFDSLLFNMGEWHDNPVPVFDDYVIDLTADQFDYKLDYKDGKVRSFLTKYPSKRAVKILQKQRRMV